MIHRMSSFSSLLEVEMTPVLGLLHLGVDTSQPALYLPMLSLEVEDMDSMTIPTTEANLTSPSMCNIFVVLTQPWAEEDSSNLSPYFHQAAFLEEGMSSMTVEAIWVACEMVVAAVYNFLAFELQKLEENTGLSFVPSTVII